MTQEEREAAAARYWTPERIAAFEAIQCDPLWPVSDTCNCVLCESARKKPSPWKRVWSWFLGVSR